MASFFVDYITVLGVGLTVILKNWLNNDRQVHQLEQVHMLAEVEKLKEQVSPHFLFCILHKIGDIAPDDQAKASDMLMELSEVLQYQLYDCNRENVLLNAEIRFISTYLKIEQLNSDTKMDYEICTEGDVNGIFVPPLLFIPLVQSAVKSFRKGDGYFRMNVCFNSGSDYLSFYCDCGDVHLSESSDLNKIRQRLESLYPQRYTLGSYLDKAAVLYLQIKL